MALIWRRSWEECVVEKGNREDLAMPVRITEEGRNYTEQTKKTKGEHVHPLVENGKSSVGHLGTR